MLFRSTLKSQSLNLTRVLPVVEIESLVAQTRALACGNVLSVVEIWRGHSRMDGFIIVKMDTNSEGLGKTAGRGIWTFLDCRVSIPDSATDPRYGWMASCCGGSGAWLKVSDLQVVSTANDVVNGRIDGCDSCAVGSNSRLDRVGGAARTNTIGTGCRGRGNVGTEAD